MRAISLVNRIEFEFTGKVVRNAIALGDLDNDGRNELVVGNDNGKAVIFKGNKECYCIKKLTFISCIAIGDVMNDKKNHLVIVTADGWCHIYRAISKRKARNSENTPGEDIDATLPGGGMEGVKDSHSKERTYSEQEEDMQLICVHTQRIPANAKDILLADVNGDGYIEMVLGLTDRVVRSYRWVSNSENSNTSSRSNSSADIKTDKFLGKLVALNKWECANQIGSITLHHGSDGLPSLLIAQPGGTFMRIKCQNNEATISQDFDSEESTSSSIVDYQNLGKSRMRNQNISTEILGDFCTKKTEENLGRSYAVATLDGTIMLVRDEVILWAMAVDHQVFALTKLDVTGRGSDDIVVCSWDGQTYILDQEKNCIRFHLEQSVQAFNSGYYSLNSNENVTCLVYVTFKNTVIIYYDIPLNDLICRKFKPDLCFLAEKLATNENSAAEYEEKLKNLKKNVKKSLVVRLLYDNFSIV